MKHAAGHVLQPASAQRPDTSCCTAERAPSGTYCPILFFDVAGFGDPRRDNDIQMAIRCGLYQILHRAFGHFEVPPAAYYREDHGDGVLAVFPPTISADTMTGLPVWLHQEIQRHNKCASPLARIQLRAALHIGPVYWDDHGVCGQALIHAARLINAQPVKDALAAAGSDLVFVVSAALYEEVIRHTPQPAGAGYRKIKARVKESSLTAWITVSGGTPPGHQQHLAAVPDTP